MYICTRAENDAHKLEKIIEYTDVAKVFPWRDGTLEGYVIRITLGASLVPAPTGGWGPTYRAGLVGRLRFDSNLLPRH